MNSKTLSPELVKELETLVNSNIDMSLFPYVKGKSIRIKHIIIRETNFGFLVFDTKNNKEIDKIATAIDNRTKCNLDNFIRYCFLIELFLV